MTEEIKTRGAGLKKQRSLQMDDETFGLLESAEQRTGLSKSALVSALIWKAYGGAPAGEDEPPTRGGVEFKHEIIETTRQQRPDADRLSSILPPEGADNFKVQGGRVKHTRDKPKMGESKVDDFDF